MRELAGLNGQDVHGVRDLLPDVLAELGVMLPSEKTAAAAEVFDHLALMCLTGIAGERWVAQKVEEVVRQADFAAEVLDLPLGALYGADDAWAGGWGPPEHELAAQVRQACAEQLAERGNSSDVMPSRG